MKDIKADITVEEIRHLQSCEYLTDDELQEKVESIKNFALILMQIYAEDSLSKK